MFMKNYYLIVTLSVSILVQSVSDLYAQAAPLQILGGTNTNPGLQGQGPNPNPEPNSKPNGPPTQPPQPPGQNPEDKKSCEKDSDSEEPKIDLPPPKNPGSVELEMGLDACPLEYSVAGGSMRLYLDKPVENMGDPILLEYNSIATAKVVSQKTLGLPVGVDYECEIKQLSGQPISFQMKSGAQVLLPIGQHADTSARVELRTASAVTNDPALATLIRQYRSSGGHMEFDKTTGHILRWASPTGRGIDFAADGSGNVAAIGLEIVRAGLAIRQVKSPAGLLDVVTEPSGRGYTISIFMPDQVGPKSGSLYATISGAKPMKSLKVIHPLNSNQLLATFTDYSTGSIPDRIRTFTYDYRNTLDDGHEWMLTKQVDGITLLSSRHVEPDINQPKFKRVIRELKDLQGNIFSKDETLQRYEDAWQGWTDVQQIETPGNDLNLRLVRSYRYGIDPVKPDFRKLNWMQTDTGMIYEFKYDTQGRMIARSRPWLDGGSSGSFVEKYDYAPLLPADVVRPGDERPRTLTIEIQSAAGLTLAIISKAYFAVYPDSANANRQTVINEMAATPSAAFGAAGNRRMVQVFSVVGAGVEAGRLFESTDELGLKTQYTYSYGSDGGLITVTTGPFAAGNLAKAGLTRKVRVEKDAVARVRLTRRELWSGTAFVPLAEERLVYSPNGHLIETYEKDLRSNRERLTIRQEWQGDQLRKTTLADGSSVEVVKDGFGRDIQTTRSAVTAVASPLGGAAYPERPSITSVTTGSTVSSLNQITWGDHTIATTGGTLTLNQFMKGDARGRFYQTTDADAYVTKTDYAKNNRDMTMTRPDTGTETRLYFLDGRMKAKVGTGVVAEYFEYLPRLAGGLVTIVRSGLVDSPRLRRSEVDMLGRQVITEAPSPTGEVIQQTTAFLAGTALPVLVTSTAPKVPPQMVEYDVFGVVIRSGSTVRAAATALQISSVDDRIQDQDQTFLDDASGVWAVSRSYLYPEGGAAVGSRYLTRESRVKLAGMSGDEVSQSYNVDSLGNWQRSISEVPLGLQLQLTRQTSSSSAGEAITVYHGGKTVERRSPSDLASSRTTYDSLGRAISEKQPRHANASFTTYTPGTNQVSSVTDASGASTQISYYPTTALGASRPSLITQADGTRRRLSYSLRGETLREWGNAAKPISYHFDLYGQMDTMTTYRTDLLADSVAWPTALTTGDTTNWIRQEATGVLLQKFYADAKGMTYLYDAAGRLVTRTNARNLTTTYSHTAWGELDITDYSDTTPSVDLDYDRIGRKSRESNGIATSTIAYSPSTLMPALETVSYDLDQNGTPELTRTLDHRYDSLRRPTGYDLNNAAIIENQATYGYDSFSRLNSVLRNDLPLASFSYTYTQNSQLLDSITGPAHTVTNTWEPDRDLLDVKENKVGSTSISKYDYGVNVTGQRTNVAQSGTAFASGRSLAWGYDPLGQLITADSSITGHDRAFLYDTIGNRKKSAASLTLPATDNYTANGLNQYTAVTAVSPQYDLDGNATSYPMPIAPSANSTLAYDAENRQVSSTVNGVTTSYLYDSQSRRIAKTTSGTRELCLYDGWNPIAEYEGSAGDLPVLKKTQLWGLDQSGSLQGAGGVGGLLSTTLKTQPGSSTYLPTYDGNGNVSEYLTVSGSTAAHFEYDPFGNTAVNTDTGNLFTYRFSTKPRDTETGLYYYGYRYYDPMTGRWPSRDPIEEFGGVNLYGMVLNNPIEHIDLLGLAMHPGATMGEIRSLWEAGYTAAQIAELLRGAASYATIVAAIAKLQRCKAVRAEIDAIKEASIPKCGCDDDDATLALKTTHYCGLALWRWFENTECFFPPTEQHVKKQQEAFDNCKKCRALQE